MSRPALEVADIFRGHGPAWRRANAGHVSLDQLKVMSAIESCRTAALGGHVARYEKCAHTRIAYNSCRNRHCPKCQGAAAKEWLADREAELLPVPYYHVVFTLPAPIADIAYQNKAEIYAILFNAAAETLITIAADPKHLGARIGLTAVLHTWGSALTHHPHVHMIVPGGGISPDGQHWISCRSLLPPRPRALAALSTPVPEEAGRRPRRRPPAVLRQSRLTGRTQCVHNLSRCPPMVTIFIGALAGGALAVLHNPDAVVAFAQAPELGRPLPLVKGVWAALATGYRTETGDAAIDQLMTRGGMSSMMITVWLIVCALAFGAGVEHGGFLNRLVNPLLQRVRSTGGLVSLLVATCIGANIITSDQYIAVVLPGRLFRAEFLKRSLAPVFLSRVIGDSATVTSPLVPWNSCGAYMAATLGVTTLGYAAFCFFNMLNPLLTIVFSFFAFRTLHSSGPQPTQPRLSA